jgi:hypothetical protein
MAMAASVWTPTNGHGSQIPTRLPEELELLLAHLTGYGREQLTKELVAAMRDPDPTKAVTRVLSAWWLTLVARHQPGYHEAMSRPSPEPSEAVYESTEELKAKLGV